MKIRTLQTYLTDHLAGARSAIELLERCRDTYPEMEGFFSELREEVEEDRAVLRSLLLRVGGSESRLKDAGAWMLEQVSRVKYADPSQSSGSSLLERLEILTLGIAGKRSLWESLDAVSGGAGRFGGLELDRLRRRAEEQHGRVERERLKVAREAFVEGVGAEATTPEPGRWSGEGTGGEDDRTLRGVLLDVDGTLIATNDAHARAWADAFREHGHEVGFETVRPLIGMGGDKLIPALTDVQAGSDEADALSDRRSEIFLERYLEGCRPFDGVKDLLERFRADGLGLVAATSASEDEMERILEVAGVEDLIDGATSASEVENSKPAGDVVRAALEKSGWRAEEAILLGDTPFDVAAGSDAGVGVVGLRCGGSSEAELAGALALYADPADLLIGYEESPFARRAVRQRVRGG